MTAAAANGHKTLAEAFAAAQADFPAVDRDGVNPHFKSKFTTLGHLLGKVRPVLNSHGLSVIQLPSRGEDGEPVLRTTILHTSGESITADAPLLLAKRDPQGQGSAITYMRRYALAAALGISDQDDDDGNAGSDPNASASSAPRPATEAQRNFLFGSGNRPGLFDDAGIDPAERPKLIRWVTKAPEEELTSHNASKLIEALAGPKDGPKPSKAEKEDKAREWREALTAGFEAKDPHALAAVALATDLPADVDGLAEQAGLEEVPFE